MRLAIQICGWLVGIPLELLILGALLRGGYRRYPLVFLYAVAEFLATVAEIPASWAYFQGAKSTLGAVWWFDQTLLQLLVYATVLSLLYRATDSRPGRRSLRIAIILGAAIFAGGSLGIHLHTGDGSWHAAWSRDLNFTAVIVDLILWTFLIAKRSADSQLLLLSSGLGVQFCGGAIGEALRQLALQNRSRALSLAGGLVMLVSYLMFLFIWWRALRTAENPAVRRAAQIAGQ
ncbi:MAG: hypothetical protein ACLQVN_10740 [Bryobacteraceae bacterium]